MNQKEYEIVLSENYKLSKRVSELEQQKAELIATLSMCIDSKRRRLYLKEINETLKKYSGE